MDETGPLSYLQVDRLAEVLRGPGWPAAPPPGIRIRPADPAHDAAAIVELYNASFDEQPRDKVTSQDVQNYMRHPGLAPQGAFLAFDDGLAVGLAVGRVDVPAPGGETRRGTVELLAVRPGYQRQGIGRALVYRALRWLADHNVATVGVVTESAVVVKVLQSYGFRVAAHPA